MANVNKYVGVAVGLLIAVVLGFFTLIFTGNLAPISQRALESNESYPGQQIMESVGVLAVVFGALLGVTILIMRVVAEQ